MAKLHGPSPTHPALPRNLDFLKKQAKSRLAALKRHRPDAKLADAQLEIARAQGFPSWRALKAAFDRLGFDGDLAVGDWVGEPEGGLPVALRIRKEDGRLHAQFDVPGLGYVGDPVERLMVAGGSMAFAITARGVNALYEGRWDEAAGAWRGRFTHEGRGQTLDFRRGVMRADRIEGLDGLWDGQSEDAWLTLRVATDEKGTFAWLGSTAVPDRWFQASRLARTGEDVTVEMKTLRLEGHLDDAGDRLDAIVVRTERRTPTLFVRRRPGEPPPWRAAT